ncbi:MAG: RNA 2',3'-cyclic phosphodiesterase [Deltaproteobacteria bacterium]|jgi:2'-5' RNA ligase|nr:RNA 2',3'-cyclic phosphodiesterase [Deltaproteobacteria bacterium]
METEAPPAEKATSRTRLFAAIPVPEQSAAKFAWLQGKTDELKSLSFRNLHINVRFFGEVPTDLLPAASMALARVSEACGPFRISMKGLFVHPSGGYHLLCARLEDHEPLKALKAAMDAALDTVEGFPKSFNRPYKPSMLLCRMKAPASEDLERIMANVRKKPIASFTVQALTLFRSRLSPQGAEHTPLLEIPLNAAPYVPKTRPGRRPGQGRRPQPGGKGPRWNARPVAPPPAASARDPRDGAPQFNRPSRPKSWPPLPSPASGLRPAEAALAQSPDGPAAPAQSTAGPTAPLTSTGPEPSGTVTLTALPAQASAPNPVPGPPDTASPPAAGPASREAPGTAAGSSPATQASAKPGAKGKPGKPPKRPGVFGKKRRRGPR